jgi:hypothetical protein
MPSFAAVVRLDRGYKSLARKRRFNGREQAIEHCIIAVAEREIGRLLRQIAKRDGELDAARVEFQGMVKSLKGKVENERLLGELNLERQKTGFLTLTLGYVRGLPEFFVTPFGEMRGRYFEQLPAFSSEALLGLAIDGESVSAERSTHDPISEADGESEGASESASAEADKTLWDGLYKMIPEKVQPVVDFIRDRLARLTPAASALLIVLVGIGMWGYGKWARSSLEDSYKYVLAQRDQLRHDMGDQKKQLEEMQKAKESAAASAGKLHSATIELERARQEIKDLRKAKEESDNEHNKQLQAARDKASADAALKEQLAKAEDRIKKLEEDNRKLVTSAGELEALTKQVAKLNGDLQEANKTAKANQTEISSLNTDLKTVNHKYGATSNMLRSVMKQLNDGLLNTNAKYLQWYQTEFKRQFNFFYQADPQIYSELGYERYAVN